MLSKNHPIILFIDRFGFNIYQDTLSNISKFNFTPDLVENLDVINKEQFVGLIATFIQINKIIPSNLVVILSENVIYVKDLAALVQKPASPEGLKLDSNEDKEHQVEVQNFLEDVPFENVLAKVVKMGSISRIVATNKDLVMTIADAFLSKGADIEAVVPSFIYGQNANFGAGLISENVRAVLGNLEILKSGNLLTGQEQMTSTQSLESEVKNSQTSEIKKPQNRKQFVLVGVFILLLVILAIVYFILGASQKIPPSYKMKISDLNSEAVPTIPQATGLTSITSSVTPSPVDLKMINIKISHSVQSESVLVSLKSGLSGLGYKNIVDEVSEVSIPERSSVVFSQDVPANLRDNLIGEIKKFLPGITVLNDQNPGFVASILIGKT